MRRQTSRTVQTARGMSLGLGLGLCRRHVPHVGATLREQHCPSDVLRIARVMRTGLAPGASRLEVPPVCVRCCVCVDSRVSEQWADLERDGATAASARSASCCRPPVLRYRVRLSSPRTQLPAGAAVQAGVLQLQRRVAGLLSVGESAAVSGLAVCGRDAGAGRPRRASRPAERDAGAAAVPRRRVPPGHSQYRVPLRGL